MHVAGTLLTDFRRFHKQFTVADGNTVIHFQNMTGNRFPMNTETVLSARQKPDFSGFKPQFRLIIGRHTIPVRNDPIVIRCTANLNDISQRICFCRIDQLTPAAEFQETHIRALFLFAL